MFSNPKKKLATEIAKNTGVEVSVVSSILTELANLAYVNATSGFILPGFGKFQIVPGAETTGINPFTKKTTVFRAPPNVEFTLDTSAKKSFLAGSSPPSTATINASATVTLNPVALVPQASDLVAAGIKPESQYRFKIGGDPEWLQAPETPVCCGEAMCFYAQLDSLNNSEYSLGDMGMLYVFICQSCNTSRSILQF